MKSLIQKWNKESYSWPNRLNLTKRYILLNFLFLFQALPIIILAKKLQLWQWTVNTFFGTNKEP